MELSGARHPPAHDPDLYPPGALPPPTPPPQPQSPVPNTPQPRWFYAPVAVHVNFVVDKIGALDRCVTHYAWLEGKRD